MASPVLAIAAAAAFLLLLASGDKKAAPPGAPPPTNQQCFRMIAERMQAEMRVKPSFAYYIADIADQIGQPATAACLRQLAQNPEVDCVTPLMASLARDVKMLGDPGVLRGIAMALRARGFQELANCYEQLALEVERQAA